MRDLDHLDRKLRAGPLRVASLFHPERSESVARESLRRRRRALLALAGTAVCAFAVTGALVLRAAAPTGATASGANTVDAGASAGAQNNATIRFADGSTAVPAGAGAQVQIDEQTGARVALRLHGAARFEVVPDRARTFEVRAGDVLVRVLGTAFSIEGRGARTHVAVARGRVEVSWPGGSAILHAGDAGSFPREPESARPGPRPAANPARDPLADAVPAASAKPDDSELEARRGGEDGRPEQGWRAAARRGDYAKAYAELEQTNPDQRAAAQPADLMLAADVARLSGHPQDALAPLRALCERFPRDKRAPVAAFTLGRVLLDDLAQAADAARAFARARELWPAGPLAEDALAREAEAWSRAGSAQRARSAAQRYQQRFPDGRHLASMRRFLAR